MRAPGAYNLVMRSRSRWISALLALAAATSLAADTAAPPPVPDEIRAFARNLPDYFSKLEDIIATETITQTLLNDTTGNATVQRRRVLVSDYQIAHLGENPAALWEFRFVRSVDGQKLPDVDRKIEDFFRLRHPSAAAERRSIVDLAVGQSLPGCYWHNLTLVLLAFGEGPVENFDWTAKRQPVSFPAGARPRNPGGSLQPEISPSLSFGRAHDFSRRPLSRTARHGVSHGLSPDSDEPGVFASLGPGADLASVGLRGRQRPRHEDGVQPRVAGPLRLFPHSTVLGKHRRSRPAGGKMTLAGARSR